MCAFVKGLQYVFISKAIRHYTKIIENIKFGLWQHEDLTRDMHHRHFHFRPILALHPPPSQKNKIENMLGIAGAIIRPKWNSLDKWILFSQIWSYIWCEIFHSRIYAQFESARMFNLISSMYLKAEWEAAFRQLLSALVAAHPSSDFGTPVWVQKTDEHGKSIDHFFGTISGRVGANERVVFLVDGYLADSEEICSRVEEASCWKDYSRGKCKSVE